MNGENDQLKNLKKSPGTRSDRNEYVEADWDTKRWCDESAKGRCENNTIFLRKNFNPLYLQRSLKGRKQFASCAATSSSEPLCSICDILHTL